MEDRFGQVEVGDTYAIQRKVVVLCSSLWTKIACPNDDVARVFQHIFQPQTVANIALYSGFPHSSFKSNNKLCMPMTRYNINRA